MLDFPIADMGNRVLGNINTAVGTVRSLVVVPYIAEHTKSIEAHCLSDSVSLLGQ